MGLNGGLRRDWSHGQLPGFSFRPLGPPVAVLSGMAPPRSRLVETNEKEKAEKPAAPVLQPATVAEKDPAITPQAKAASSNSIPGYSKEVVHTQKSAQHRLNNDSDSDDEALAEMFGNYCKDDKKSTSQFRFVESPDVDETIDLPHFGQQVSARSQKDSDLASRACGYETKVNVQPSGRQASATSHKDSGWLEDQGSSVLKTNHVAATQGNVRSDLPYGESKTASPAALPCQVTRTAEKPSGKQAAMQRVERVRSVGLPPEVGSSSDDENAAGNSIEACLDDEALAEEFWTQVTGHSGPGPHSSEHVSEVDAEIAEMERALGLLGSKPPTREGGENLEKNLGKVPDPDNGKRLSADLRNYSGESLLDVIAGCDGEESNLDEQLNVSETFETLNVSDEEMNVSDEAMF